MQCHGLNCKRTAGYVPVIHVPAKHLPEELMPTAKMVIPLPLCNRCVERCKIGDFLTERARENMQRVNNDRAEMDFSKARLEKSKASPRHLQELINGGVYAAG